MPWKKMLVHVTGEVDHTLLARVEYLIEENPPKGLADILCCVGGREKALAHCGGLARLNAELSEGKPA